jgi:hypothetical protein
VGRLATHREHVIATDEDVHLADDEVAVGGLRVDVHRLQDGEHARTVFLDLGPLVALARVFDGQFVQAELLGHHRKFVVVGVDERHPDEAIGPDHVVRDRLDADVGELAPVLISDAVDQHGERARIMAVGYAPERTLSMTSALGFYCWRGAGP